MLLPCSSQTFFLISVRPSSGPALFWPDPTQDPMLCVSLSSQGDRDPSSPTSPWTSTVSGFNAEKRWWGWMWSQHKFVLEKLLLPNMFLLWVSDSFSCSILIVTQVKSSTLTHNTIITVKGNTLLSLLCAQALLIFSVRILWSSYFSPFLCNHRPQMF